MAGVFKAYKSAAWRTATKIQTYHSGAWVEVLVIRAWKVVSGSGQWREVYRKPATVPPAPPAPVVVPSPAPPVILNVTLNKTSTSGTKKTGAGLVTAASVTASVSNGTAPYTYTWTRVSWTSVTTPNITSANAATTTFTQQINSDDGEEDAQFKVTVQDSLGNTGSAVVDAQFFTLTREGLGGTA